jgi:hypothetical protein
MDEPFIGQSRQIASTKPRQIPGKLTSRLAGGVLARATHDLGLKDTGDGGEELLDASLDLDGCGGNEDGGGSRMISSGRGDEPAAS